MSGRAVGSAGHGLNGDNKKTKFESQMVDLYLVRLCMWPEYRLPSNSLDIPTSYNSSNAGQSVSGYPVVQCKMRGYFLNTLLYYT